MFNIIASSGTIINPQITSAVHDLLLNILQLAVLGLSLGVSYGVKLWINSMQSGWKKAVAERLVKYAQQRLEKNEDKLAYVSQQLSAHFPRLKQEEVQHLLEEAVANLAPARTTNIVLPPTAVVVPPAQPETKQ